MLITDLNLIPSYSSSTWLLVALSALILYWALWILYSRTLHPLASIPGPFVAAITPLYYQQGLRSGIGERYQLAIHEKYGPFVRITPNHVQIALPEAIETIYGPKGNVTKSEFYTSFTPRNMVKQADLFAERDEVRHTYRRRIVAPFYTPGFVLECEPRIGRIVSLFCKQMDTFVSTGESFDISVWIRKYTFDVIGVLFYGHDDGFGFIQRNIDYNGWMHLMSKMPGTVSSLAYLPWGCQTLYMLFQMLKSDTRKAIQGVSKVQFDAERAVRDRVAERSAAGSKIRQQVDALNGMLDVVETRGTELGFDLDDVAVELWETIWAGADTTAYSLSGIFYVLMKHPDKLSKLLKTLEEAFASGALCEPVRYSDAIKIPYLRAVVTEAMRIAPPVGSMLPRIVGKGGLIIGSHHFPEGIRVGINGMVVQRDKGVFGDDADEFVPERWLRCGEKEAANMERHLLTFGLGKRVCLGKNITMTEMYKLLPTILHRYHFELQVDRWNVEPGWFNFPSNIMVNVTERKR